MIIFYIICLLFAIIACALFYTTKAKVYEFWASKCTKRYFFIIYKRPGDWLGRYVIDWDDCSMSLTPLVFTYDDAIKLIKYWADNPSEFEEHQKQRLELAAANKRKYKKVVYRSQPQK